MKKNRSKKKKEVFQLPTARRIHLAASSFGFTITVPAMF